MKALDIRVISDKIKDSKPLTEEERIFYIMATMNVDEAEALRIIAIASNEDENVLID